MLTSAGYKLRVFSPTFSLLPSEQRTLPSSGAIVTRFGAHKRADDASLIGSTSSSKNTRANPSTFFTPTSSPKQDSSATLAGRYLNIPSVVSIRGNDVDRAAFDPQDLTHNVRALQHASIVTANAKESIRKAKAFFDREIILIPNGVDSVSSRCK
ncbi:MAG: hypothetical protein U0X93_12640 [Anaerolineales bacterium]